MAELIDTPLLPEVPSHIRPRHADVTRSLPTTPSPSESDVVRQQALSPSWEERGPHLLGLNLPEDMRSAAVAAMAEARCYASVRST
ncbi:MAG: hypothetical protein LC799_34830, partial [Actinobacteria bacterium]|nr:hypothetical protein [Actinomycetota bacterium]